MFLAMFSEIFILRLLFFFFMAQNKGEIISRELLSILACPVCKGGLLLKERESGLYCKKCDYLYPIEEGVPVLLPPDMIEARGKN